MNKLERMTALQNYLSNMAQQGFVVVEQVDPFTVYLRERKEQPKDANHILHVLLCIFTGGLWIPFWIGAALVASTRIRRYNREPFEARVWEINVDEGGEIKSEELTVYGAS